MNTKRKKKLCPNMNDHDLLLTRKWTLRTDHIFLWFCIIFEFVMIEEAINLSHVIYKYNLSKSSS